MIPGLALLDMKKTPIEKYQYLSVLRNTNVHLFYRLLANNVKVRPSQESHCQEVKSDVLDCRSSHLSSTHPPLARLARDGLRSTPSLKVRITNQQKLHNRQHTDNNQVSTFHSPTRATLPLSSQTGLTMSKSPSSLTVAVSSVSVTLVSTAWASPLASFPYTPHAPVSTLSALSPSASTLAPATRT